MERTTWELRVMTEWKQLALEGGYDMLWTDTLCFFHSWQRAWLLVYRRMLEVCARVLAPRQARDTRQPSTPCTAEQHTDN